MRILKQIGISAILIIIAIIGWIVFYPSSSLVSSLGLDRFTSAPSQDTTPGGWGRGGGAATVIAQPIASAPVTQEIRAIGDAQALAVVDIQPDVNGTLDTISVTPGAKVSQGDVLFTLESTPAQLAVRRAQQEYDSAQQTFERTQALTTRGAGTEVALQSAQDAVALSSIALEDAQYALSQHTITAPMDGEIGLFSLTPGTRVTSSTILTRLQTTDPLVISFRLPERAFQNLTQDTALTLIPLSNTDDRLTGTITAIDKQIDTQSRTFRVEAHIKNTNGLYQPGMAFEIIAAFPGDIARSVPPVSVRWADAGAHIWVVRDDKAVQLPVDVLMIEQDRILVRGDIEPQDQVITEGMTSVRDGGSVQLAGDTQ